MHLKHIKQSQMHFKLCRQPQKGCCSLTKLLTSIVLAKLLMNIVFWATVAIISQPSENNS